MRIAFYEDGATAGLGPVALTRPLFDLVCGQCSLRERVLRRFGFGEWGACVRPHLVETVRETHPEARVNAALWLAREPTLLINARWLPTAAALDHIADDDAGIIDGTPVYLTLDPLEAPLLTPDGWNDALGQIVRTRRIVPAEGRLIRHPWDLVSANAEQLEVDFLLARNGEQSLEIEQRGHVAVVGPVERAVVHPSATIDPFVVLDVTRGPITLAADVRVQAFTRLEGPCHVGRGSQLFRANVRGGTTIGPMCRVGGEIEASILHGHVNKYHDGFLGHSYVCPWVNLGAFTTNSDLRNDYSTVRVPLAGTPIETGETKVGCFIGDHTKTALGSLFNTGSSVGVMCQVLPAGELLPKHVPSFCRVWHGELTEPWDLDRSFAAARVAMSRRGFELTAAQIRLYRHLFEQTRMERAAALERGRDRADQVTSHRNG